MSHSRRNLQARHQEVKAFKLKSICRDLRYHFSQEHSINDSFCSFGSGQVTFFASHLKSLLSPANCVSEASKGFPEGKQGGLSVIPPLLQLRDADPIMGTNHSLPLLT